MTRNQIAWSAVFFLARGISGCDDNSLLDDCRDPANPPCPTRDARTDATDPGGDAIAGDTPNDESQTEVVEASPDSRIGDDIVTAGGEERVRDAGDERAPQGAGMGGIVSLDGSPRPPSVGSTDAGPVGQVFVAVSGSDTTGDGSVDHPWRTIGTGLARHGAAMNVVVRDGTYEECVVFGLDQEGITLEAASSVRAVISGQGCKHAVWFKTGLSGKTVLRGFLIKGGSTSEGIGGGIFVEPSSSPVIELNTIRENFAWSGGGGIAILPGSKAVVRGNVITSNSVTYDGAGIRVEGASPLIEANLISNNVTSQYHGGGIDCASQCTARIVRNVITGNQTGASSVGYGGGIACDESSPVIVSNLIVGNVSTAYFAGGSKGGYGGGIYAGGFIYDANPSILNNTIVANRADYGGGIAVGTQDGIRRRSAPSILRNVIVQNEYGSSLAGGEGIYVGNDASIRPRVDFNDVWSNRGGKFGGWLANTTIGPGNIDQDPRFVQGELDDFYLAQTAAGQAQDSLCVDAGGVLAAEAMVSDMSTRTNAVGDGGLADLGYHR